MFVYINDKDEVRIVNQNSDGLKEELYIKGIRYKFDGKKTGLLLVRKEIKQSAIVAINSFYVCKKLKMMNDCLEEFSTKVATLAKDAGISFEDVNTKIQAQKTEMFSQLEVAAKFVPKSSIKREGLIECGAPLRNQNGVWLDDVEFESSIIRSVGKYYCITAFCVDSGSEENSEVEESSVRFGEIHPSDTPPTSEDLLGGAFGSD